MRPMEKEIEDVDFNVIKEDWNEYSLKDGTKLKIKLVLVKVKRSNKYDQFGEPLYMVQSQNIVKVAEVPDELKRNPNLPTDSTMVR